MGRTRTDTAFRPSRPQSKIKKDPKTRNERSHTTGETAGVEEIFAGKEEKVREMAGFSGMHEMWEASNKARDRWQTFERARIRCSCRRRGLV